MTPAPKPTDLMTENEAVAWVCAFLENHGYSIEQQLATTQQGDDIIAVRCGQPVRRLHIEVKGATSSRQGSQRFGIPFDSAQVRIHVAEALFKSAQVLSREVGTRETVAGIALPANDLHTRQLATVRSATNQLGIAVFWVEGDGEVNIESPWAIAHAFAHALVSGVRSVTTLFRSLGRIARRRPTATDAC